MTLDELKLRHDALLAARYSGTRSVSYDGKSVNYGSDAEIANFIELVRNLASEATVLLIEHNMPVVMALAHRITVLDRGAILAEGTPEDIRANRHVQAAYLGTDDA